MASVQLDPASKLYRIRFRFHFGGKGYFRSLGIKNEAEAKCRECGQRAG